MNLFTEIKSAVSAKEAAIFYGVKVGRVEWHNFPKYGVQRAWICVKAQEPEGFMSIPPELEKELPFE